MRCLCVFKWTLWYSRVAIISPRNSSLRERERREKERDEWERQYGRQSHSPSPSKYGMITNSHMDLIHIYVCVCVHRLACSKRRMWSISLERHASDLLGIVSCFDSLMGFEMLWHAVVLIMCRLSLRPRTQLVQKVCENSPHGSPHCLSGHDYNTRHKFGCIISLQNVLKLYCCSQTIFLMFYFLLIRLGSVT